MTTQPPTLLQFPCRFPIKVIGDHTPTFMAEILALTQKHFPDFTEADMQQSTSQNQRYLALTLNVYAQDQQTLDALYHDLSAHPDKKMVL